MWTTIAAWFGVVAGSFGFGLAVATVLRLNRSENEVAEDVRERAAEQLAEAWGDAFYELERRTAALERDAGLDGSWEESVRTKH